MTKDKTVTMQRELAEDRVRFEKWHNDFYGPQDKFNPIRSLAHDSFSVGLGYDDPTVQAQFCAFRAVFAAPVVERQPYGYWICPKGNPKLGSFHHEVLDTTEQYCEVTPLYSSPPAPVAVDERAEFENYYRDRIMGNRTGVRFLRSSSGAYLDREVVEMWSGWQARACLDKVKEMNQ